MITRSQYRQLFEEETQRLGTIEFDTPVNCEHPTALVHQPLFLSIMEEQVMLTLAKEQIKNLPRFGGGPDEDIMKWLQDIEEVFDRAQLQPSNKYTAVQSYLTDSAAKWFRHNKLNICDWPTFKIEILKVYRPSLDQALLKLEQRKQSTDELVMDYYYDKLQLCLQADPHMSANMILHYLTKGLSPSLIPHVIRQHPSTPAEFLTFAQDEEKVQQMLQGLMPNKTCPPDDDGYSYEKDPVDDNIALIQRPNDTTPYATTSQQHPPVTPPPLMTSQFNYGPPVYATSQYSYPSTPAAPMPRQCYTCYGFGHISKNCPNRKNVRRGI